ncbi:hypothetical protein NDU88_005734 [Pleurodeles waltl]|uniref:Uncharacterized protein n=1 Tax=Pleurodeles waltl TaxID=8319 RepID=A0AAV7N574_PLEWA|nr:hypothetical protein NDU88_005734 [Pleurodeles waltl]
MSSAAGGQAGEWREERPLLPFLVSPPDRGWGTLLRPLRPICRHPVVLLPRGLVGGLVGPWAPVGVLACGWSVGWCLLLPLCFDGLSGLLVPCDHGGTPLEMPGVWTYVPFSWRWPDSDPGPGVFG